MTDDPYAPLRAYVRRYEKAQKVIDERPAQVKAMVEATSHLHGHIAAISKITGLSREHVTRLARGRTSGVVKDQGATASDG